MNIPTNLKLIGNPPYNVPTTSNLLKGEMAFGKAIGTATVATGIRLFVNDNNSVTELLLNNPIDLSSGAEVLTGELFNGKPVYATNFSGQVSSVSSQNSFTIDTGLTGITNMWIDFSNSHWTDMVGMAGTVLPHYGFAGIGNNNANPMPFLGTIGIAPDPSAPNFYINLYDARSSSSGFFLTFWFSIRLKYTK
ncbi:MAG: hypothetical protein FWD60_13495 [Candidatus Azobacteroides sp.]|nr:hypothetical protein [Candidatus Azobacteroides sp.]